MNAMEFQKNLLLLMMHVFGNLCILYRKRKRFSISFDFTFLYKFNGPGLCSAKRIPTIPKEVARKLRILLVLEIYLRYLEKYGSGICTFECHDKNGATKRLKSGKIVGIINKQLVKAPIIGCDFHFGRVENTLVLSQLNDEILQTCIKKL